MLNECDKCHRVFPHGTQFTEVEFAFGSGGFACNECVKKFFPVLVMDDPKAPLGIYFNAGPNYGNCNLCGADGLDEIFRVSSPGCGNGNAHLCAVCVQIPQETFLGLLYDKNEKLGLGA